MLVHARELKKKLGKYLRVALREDVIVVRSGQKVARLSAYVEYPAKPEQVLSLRERAETDYYPHKATYEAFLDLIENSVDRFEYIDGEIYLLASPKVVHQLASSELQFVFATYFREKDCRPMYAPFDITLTRHADDINIVQPDLVVICDLEQKINERGYYMGVPKLVVEILSESTRRKDMVKKLDLYLSTGIREYWIVNPFNASITIYEFADKDIVNSRMFQQNEIARSFVFKDLGVAVDAVL